MDCHWAWEKQPARVDHSSLADFDCEFIYVALCSWRKIKSAVIGNKTGFPRSSHKFQYFNFEDHSFFTDVTYFFKDENFVDSQAAVKSVKITSLKNMYVYNSSLKHGFSGL